MTETDRIHMLIEIFEWNPECDLAQFQALVILRRARRESVPSWDDFVAKRVR